MKKILTLFFLLITVVSFSQHVRITQIKDVTVPGANLLKIVQPPSVPLYVRLNVDGSVSTLTASDFLTAIGGGAGGGDMYLGQVQTVTDVKNFVKDKLAMIGTSTGKNIFSVANTSATNYTNTLPAKDGTFAMTSDIGTWGALAYPTWSSGTPFVKMTSAGTFALDANTYITSLSGAVLTDQTSGQTIGSTGARLAMLWATDITATNAITGSVTGNAGTVTNGIYTTSQVTSLAAATDNKDKYLHSNTSTGALEWSTVSGGFTDPMTTRGDIMYRNASNATDRLALGTTGKVLMSNGTDLGYSASALGTAAYAATGDFLAVGGTAAKATILETTRAIYGNNFDGSAALTGIIASTYGGTGNGFTKFTGATTAEKTYTLPDANATLLYSGGALGTPSGGTVTNLTGTASININGTVGATTPSTGVFTTVQTNTSNTELKTLTAGENVSAGNLCYLKSDGKMWKVDCDAAATTDGFLAIATASISANATGVFHIRGEYTTSGLTAASPYFISPTAGAWVTPSPSTTNQYLRKIGFALSTTVLWFNPSNDYAKVQ